MRYTADYLEEVTLDDGQRLRLRLVRPSDQRLLERGFQRLSPGSRYQRFFTVRDYLTPAELRYLTECDGVDHVALGALTCPDPGSEEEGVGIARFIRNRERPETAEAAVAVIDDYQRRGIGHLLLSRLIEAGAERGIKSFSCVLLASNRGMRTLILEAAPSAVIRPDDGPEVITVDVPLDALTAKMEGPHQPLGRLLAIVAQGLVLVRRVLHQDEARPQEEVR
jgi:GNAT superfamily N-acetyltransferase